MLFETQQKWNMFFKTHCKGGSECKDTGWGYYNIFQKASKILSFLYRLCIADAPPLEKIPENHVGKSWEFF